jgi:hypothetical protein
MKLIGFKIWLEDGSIVKADDFSDLPSTGIVVLMGYYDEWYDVPNNYYYRKVVDGCDWYYLSGGDILGVRSSAKVGEWQPKPQGIHDDTLIKQGVLVSDEVWQRIVADSDKELTY